MMYNSPLTADPGQSIEDALSARALLSYIRRHLALVLVLAMLGSAAGMVAGLGLPTWYKAEGVLVIPAVPQRIAELQELPDASPDQDALASEVDILQSRSVIEPVVRSLKLWQAPEFQPTEYPDGWTWQRAEAALGAMWRNFWGIADEPADGPRKPTPTSTGIANGQALSQAQIDDLVGAYVGYLTVANDGHSMTLRISYRALTRERAAEIVNAHLESYRNFQVETKVAAAEHANTALRSQVGELRQQLSLADAAVARYRAEHGLSGAAEDRGGMSAQLAGLNNELITARADLKENEAHLAEIGAGTGSETLPEVVGSGTIGGLRGQEAQLLAHEADLSKYHGDQYPDLQRLRASLQSVRSQISRQTGRERAAALQLVQRARTRETFLERNVAALTVQLNSADVGLEQLQGKAEIDQIAASQLREEDRGNGCRSGADHPELDYRVSGKCFSDVGIVKDKTADPCRRLCRVHPWQLAFPTSRTSREGVPHQCSGATAYRFAERQRDAASFGPPPEIPCRYHLE